MVKWCSTVRIDKADSGFYDPPNQRLFDTTQVLPRSLVIMDTHEETIDLWQDHSLTFLEMAFRTDHRERLEKMDGYAKKVGDCGDTVEFFINLSKDTIASLSYDINGCLNTNACCNAVVSLVEGKSMDAAWQLTPEQVAEFLQSLPSDHFHCAELVVGTLYLALADASENRRSPWKQMYR
jgi:nitrogen fixation NifU-like protein